MIALRFDTSTSHHHGSFTKLCCAVTVNQESARRMPPKRKKIENVASSKRGDRVRQILDEGWPELDCLFILLNYFLESTATEDLLVELGARRRSQRQIVASQPSDQDDAISIHSDDPRDNTAERAQLNPAGFEKMFVPQLRSRKRVGELQPDLEHQHPLSEVRVFGDIASSTLMPAEYRAQKGQVVMVDCVPYDRKPVGFEGVTWMMNGDACLLMETWKLDDEWVKGRRQFNSDKHGEFSGPIERWPSHLCCLCEEHVLRSGSQNHFFGFFNANPDYPNPFMVSWSNMRRGIDDESVVEAMTPSDQFLARLPGPICRFDIVRYDFDSWCLHSLCCINRCDMGHVQLSEAERQKLKTYPLEHQNMEWLLLFAKADFSFTRALLLFVTNWRLLDSERGFGGAEYDEAFVRNVVFREMYDFETAVREVNGKILSLESQAEWEAANRIWKDYVRSHFYFQ